MADLATIWKQNTQAVYDQADNQIGYYVDLPTLASGHVMLFSGQPLGDPWNWQIKAGLGDLTFGQMVNAGQYLTQKGFSPAWMSAQEVAAMRGASGAAGIPDAAGQAVDQAENSVGQVLQAPKRLSSALAGNWQTLALYGAAGLVALLVVKKALA